MGSKERQQKRRTHKVYEKFYVNQDGEITEHISARGGIYKVRSANWKVIKDCETTNDLQALISIFQDNLKEEIDTKMRTEWLTAIKMGTDYYQVLNDEEIQVRLALPLNKIYERENLAIVPRDKFYYDEEPPWFHRKVEQTTAENRTRLIPIEKGEITVIDNRRK